MSGKAEKYIHPVFLLRESLSTERNEVGNPIKKTKKIRKLAADVETGTNEFFGAKTLGARTVKTIKLREFDYHGETMIEIDGTVYDVLKTNDAGTGRIRLTCRDHVTGGK